MAGPTKCRFRPMQRLLAAGCYKPSSPSMSGSMKDITWLGLRFDAVAGQSRSWQGPDEVEGCVRA